jgi:hypothetical protein
MEQPCAAAPAAYLVDAADSDDMAAVRAADAGVCAAQWVGRKSDMAGQVSAPGIVSASKSNDATCFAATAAAAAVAAADDGGKNSGNMLQSRKSRPVQASHTISWSLCCLASIAVL